MVVWFWALLFVSDLKFDCYGANALLYLCVEYSSATAQGLTQGLDVETVIDNVFCGILLLFLFFESVHTDASSILISHLDVPCSSSFPDEDF